MEALQPCDLLFAALPHGKLAEQIDEVSALAPRIIDLSADFRLDNAATYQQWYEHPHPSPGWLPRFVYGLPELYRESLATSNYASGVGCNATATNLALWPLAEAGILHQAVVEVKVGSSEGGNASSFATHHPERSGAVRSFAPVRHRHQAEILQTLGVFSLHFSATAIEMVRGVLCTAHAFVTESLDEKAVWQIYRDAYQHERFVRLVRDRRGIYRYPEPKILSGTNFCDVGLAVEEGSNRVVVISAIDNLMKGAAGSAVQSMNVMLGWEEDAGLNFVGLHPI